ARRRAREEGRRCRGLPHHHQYGPGGASGGVSCPHAHPRGAGAARPDALEKEVGGKCMGSLSWVHWVILLLVVVLIFGTKKLRNIGADLGGAVRGFKDGMREGGDKAGEPATSPQVSAKTVEGEVKGKTETKA